MDITSKPFSFSVHTNSRFGAGITLNLPEYLKELGVRRVGIVVDAGLSTSAHWAKVLKILRDSLEVVVVFENSVSEPDYDYLDECKQPFLGKQMDGLIGVGGGSTMDLAKAISVLVTNPGPAIQYRGFNLVKNPGPVVIAIPTTAGTGSEVTPYAVFTDKKEMRKFGINTSLYIPKLALLDPLMTTSCPRSVTISSGMDALVHSVESYVAQKSSPASRVLSRAAFSLIVNALPRVVEEPDHVEWRGRMLLGAYIAGMALMNSGSGPGGAMSYPLGVRFHVPHGIAGAVFLPIIVRFNVQAGYTAYADLFDCIEGADTRLSVEEKSRRFCDHLFQLCDKLEIPKTLDSFGMVREDIPMFIEQTTLLKGALEMNPVPFSVEDARVVLDQMLPVSKKETKTCPVSN